MTTQTTVPTAEAPLYKRIGKAAYRVLELMTESAYRGYQARMDHRFTSYI